MGIPAFYRWLVDRYPLAAVDAIEEAPVVVNGVRVPVDATRPNPIGFEFDNLYLDLNGIIHPCIRHENLTDEDVFKKVFKYIDRIFSIVRPRKLLYMAIDGVPPRAKMNQQRARRFSAASKEASRTERLRGNYESESKNLATEKLHSNIITPGTEFMALLSSALRYYVHLRINVDTLWQGIKVILSDASVPGEGEHKIMSYIRLQRNLPGFDPNTRHCMYGLDADLIMLALATHEIHFSILREDFGKTHKDSKILPQRKGNSLIHRCKERGNLKQGALCRENVEDFILRQKFQFLNIWVLREYLAHDLRIQDQTVKADLERLIDDFVFMCLFVGNDFLPHVPSLKISEGAIDLLMIVYQKEFVYMGGYLTSSSEVNLEHVQHFLKAVGSHESAIFRKRSQVWKERKIIFRGSSTNVQKEREVCFQGSSTSSSVKEVKNSTIHMFDDGNCAIDKVTLGEEGWKERYYAEKFEVNADDDRERVRSHAVLKYIEGICWVMHYYYEGVCSWQWFYPYHYAPLASDFNDLDQLEIRFALGKPFKPFDQLMGVLPAARKLMTDPSSPIFDFYPSDYELDMNRKRNARQAVCRLPFIKESRLLSEISKVEHTLTDEEKQRNSLGLDALFVHISHPLAEKIFSFCKRKKDHPKLPKAKVKRKINPIFSGGMNGYMYISDKPVSPLEILSPIDDMEMITNNKVISVLYKYPTFHSHIPKPPKGVTMPGQSVRKQDCPPPPVLWYAKSAIFWTQFPDRSIPKSVSGPCQANLAHRLVSEYYPAMQQEITGGSCEIYVDSEATKRTEANDGPDNTIKETSHEEDKCRRKRKRKRSRCSSSNTECCQDNGMEPIPMSVSGPCLANLDPQLVSEYYPAKRQERTDGGCENYVDSEARMTTQSNDGPNNKIKESSHEDNECRGERSIPKSVSGPCQANLAHRLVSKYYPAMQQEITGGSCEIYVDSEATKKTEANDGPDNTIKETSHEEDKCRRKRKRKRSRCSSSNTECCQDNGMEPIPMSVSGPCLANLDPQLVSEYYPAKRQERTDGGCENYVDSEARMTTQSNDGPNNKIKESSHEDNKCRGKRKRKRSRGSSSNSERCQDNGMEAILMSVSGPCLANLDLQLVSEFYPAKRQERTDGGCENYVDSEARMTTQSNDGPNNKIKESSHEDNKCRGKRKRKRSRGSSSNSERCQDNGMEPIPMSVSGPCLANLDPQLVSEFYPAKQQERTDGGCENYVDSEARMTTQSNDGPNNKIKESSHEDNKCRGKRKRKRSRGSSSNSERCQNNGMEAIPMSVSGPRLANLDPQHVSEFFPAKRQERTDGGCENYVDSEARMTTQSNDGPNNKIKESSHEDNKCRGKRKRKRKRSRVSANSYKKICENNGMEQVHVA